MGWQQRLSTMLSLREQLESGFTMTPQERLCAAGILTIALIGLIARQEHESEDNLTKHEPISIQDVE